MYLPMGSILIISKFIEKLQIVSILIPPIDDSKGETFI
jgi:hypothetical protein